MKIYVKFKAPKTVGAFLKKLFSGPHGWYSGYSVETYKNEECTKVQCTAGRCRSIRDLVSCVKTYFPDETLETIMSTLLKLKWRGKYLHCSYCSTIRQSTIAFYAFNQTSGIAPSATKGYNWGYVFHLLGIKTRAELDNYSTGK